MSSRRQEMKMMDDARKRFGEIYTDDVRSVDTLITDMNVIAQYWAFNDFYELFLVKYTV